VGKALENISEAITGLRNLAALAADRPDVARAVNTHMTREPLRILLYVGERDGQAGVPERIADTATAAAAHGAEISRHHADEYGGIDARFGHVQLHIYARLHDIGAVTTRTESVQITNWQPHPLLAALPTGTPGR
jgi:hypothetical protein